MTVRPIGGVTQCKLTKEQRASAWVAVLAGNSTGCPPHILPPSDLDKNNPVAISSPIYLISDLYISDL